MEIMYRICVCLLFKKVHRFLIIDRFVLFGMIYVHIRKNTIFLKMHTYKTIFFFIFLSDKLSNKFNFK